VVDGEEARIRSEGLGLRRLWTHVLRWRVDVGVLGLLRRLFTGLLGL
jgi:hypothetical protein